jgi:hypothetical protein
LPDDQPVPQAEVDSWTESVATMYYGEFARGDHPAAEHAAANLMSGWGILNAPAPVLEMIRQALELGYMTALQHVRHGDFDNEIRMWRPDLAGG